MLRVGGGMEMGTQRLAPGQGMALSCSYPRRHLVQLPWRGISCRCHCRGEAPGLQSETPRKQNCPGGVL